MSAQPERPPLLDQQPTPPEDLDLFRLARLLLLLAEVGKVKKPRALDIERLGFYDFFAANPFLMVDAESPAGTRLALAGFNSRTLGYQSAAHLFATRRERIRFDLSRLVGLAMVETVIQEGKIAFAVSERGVGLADTFASLYAQSYRESAALVAGAFNKLSDSKLRVEAGNWLRAESFLIDLVDEPLDDRGEA
jgi:hypothetical protein